MKLDFDETKRLRTLEERGLDFAYAGSVFNSGTTFTIEDDRRDYGEQRMQTMGLLDQELVMVVWTPRPGDVRRIISMRKCNDRERERYERALRG